MLSIACFNNPDAWSENVYSAYLAYNSTQQAATGASPFILAFNFQPAPPGLWSLKFSRGETSLTSDLRRAGQAVSSSLG
jgi:hypothetical protein